MFNVGSNELIIIVLIAFLLFGNRLPEIMRSVGKGLREFQREKNRIMAEINAALDERDSRNT